jgi:hypothetical protein
LPLVPRQQPVDQPSPALDDLAGHQDQRVDEPLDRTIASAKKAGGLCIIAHPGRDEGGGIMRAEQLDRILEIEAIDGLEQGRRTVVPGALNKVNAVAPRGLPQSTSDILSANKSIALTQINAMNMVVAALAALAGPRDRVGLHRPDDRSNLYTTLSGRNQEK